MRTILFSGHTWHIRSSGLSNPGPNYFSDSPRSVYIDKRGLHIQPIFEDGVWKCAEISISTPLGYGKYEVIVECDFGALNPYLVAALFLYESDTRELDIEYSRMMVGKDKGQFVVQPGSIFGNTHIFTQSFASKDGTHAQANIKPNQYRWMIDWQKDKVMFSASDKGARKTWTYTYGQNCMRKIKTWFYVHVVAPIVRFWKSRDTSAQDNSVHNIASTEQLSPDHAKLIVNLWLYKGIEYVATHSHIDQDAMKKGICIRSFRFIK